MVRSTARMQLFVLALLFSVGESWLPCNGPIRSAALLAKRKPSMAEKRKRRAAKRVQSVAAPAVSGAKPPPTSLSPTPVETEPEAPSKPSVEGTKAKQLLQAQRASVDALTAFKEALDRLPVDEMKAALDSQGYWYADNVLDNPTLIETLASEGSTLLDKSMLPDLERLGSGEYVVALQGGAEQYTVCPRSIEFVVTATKHFPLEGLSDQQCQGTMRTYSKQSQQASTQLLVDDSVPFVPESQILAGPDDVREVSLRYYVVPDDWTTGGGLTFGDKHVAAARDRLVLWKSKETAVRADLWTDSPLDEASCIDLHLVKAVEL